MTKIKLPVISCIIVLFGVLISLPVCSKSAEKSKQKLYPRVTVSFTAITPRTYKLTYGEKVPKIVLSSPTSNLNIYFKQLSYKLNRCHIEAEPISISGGLLFIGGYLVCSHHKDKIAVLAPVINIANRKGKPSVLSKTKFITLSSKRAAIKATTPTSMPNSYIIFYNNVTIKKGAQLKFFPISNMTRKWLETGPTR